MGVLQFICFLSDLTKKLEKVGPFECDELEKHCRARPSFCALLANRKSCFEASHMLAVIVCPSLTPHPGFAGEVRWALGEVRCRTPLSRVLRCGRIRTAATSSRPATSARARPSRVQISGAVHWSVASPRTSDS